jgi:hypothetical protein
MYHHIKRITILLSAVVVFFSCKKKFDDYYAAPASLEAPIYQQLLTKGNFTKFTSLIDKAGYKQTLSTAGYWTIFAPTDSAFAADTEFQTFLSSKGIGSFDAIDSLTAQSIVQFLLVYNAFKDDRLDDYQSNVGWVENSAFKRRTAYYTGFYKDTDLTGKPVIALASNRNGNTSTISLNDNNNKYIPFFTTNYLSLRAIPQSDYNYFYPNTPFSGFNVANAKVTERNIAAENGVIHVIDHVVTPLPSMDQYMRTNGQYSEFRKLIDKYMASFVLNADASHRYQVLTGVSADVYIKLFSGLLAFSPNNENFFKLQDNDAQQNGWSLMAPKNDSLLAYINKISAEGYGSIDKMPAQVIADFINSHMWQAALWPSKFSTTYNYLGEPAHINSTSDVALRKILSNGFFYGTNKVNEPNAFSTVYGKAYLNPKQSVMTKLMEGDTKTIVTNPNAKFVLFMMPDAVLSQQGYTYNVGLNTWSYNNVSNDSNRLNLLRILNTEIAENSRGELDKLLNMSAADSGTVVTIGGEYIKFKYNAASPVKIQMTSVGTRDRNFTVLADSIKTAKNGFVVYLNNLLYFTYAPVGQHLETLGTPTTSEYNYFWNYLKNSTLYDAPSKNFNILQTGSFYTILVPKNDAIKQAIIDKLLPGTVSGSTVTPNFNPTASADKTLVENFIKYHVLDKYSIIGDGKNDAVNGLPTFLKNASGDPYKVVVQSVNGALKLTDNTGRVSNSILSLSNQLSNRVMIHLLDNYLKYQ